MTARGIRNNNPGNIRLSDTKWVGQVPGEDKEFVTFVDMPHGIRALVTLLRTYYVKHRLDTVFKIINRWAPPSENDTDAYIAAVCGPAGIKPHDLLENSRLTFEYLARQIAKHENGRDAEKIPAADWIAGLDLVFGNAVAGTKPLPVEPPLKEEKPMSPFILPAFEFLKETLPTLIRHFGKGEQSEANAQTVEKIVTIAKKTVGAANEQEMVERIKADPSLVQTADKAVQENWFDLTDAGGGGIAGARAADFAFVQNEGPWWSFIRSPSFWALILLLPLVYLIILSVIGVLGPVQWSDDVRAAIAGTIVGTIVGGAVGYYWGQTTSRNRATAGA